MLIGRVDCNSSRRRAIARPSGLSLATGSAGARAFLLGGVILMGLAGPSAGDPLVLTAQQLDEVVAAGQVIIIDGQELMSSESSATVVVRTDDQHVVVTAEPGQTITRTIPLDGGQMHVEVSAKDHSTSVSTSISIQSAGSLGSDGSWGSLSIVQSNKIGDLDPR